MKRGLTEVVPAEKIATKSLSHRLMSLWLKPQAEKKNKIFSFS
jgi:hypothetical protein